MRCFPLLVLAVSAFVMAMLAWVTHMGEAPGVSPTSPVGSNAESRKPQVPSPGTSQIFERKTKPASTLAERLAENPHTALEWLLETSGGGQRASLCTDSQFQSAVSAAANRLMQVTRSQTREGNSLALENFIQLWAAVDVHSAYEWVHQIPSSEVRSALMVRVALVGSQIAPGEAACLVVEELPPGAVQEEAAMMVLHQWALQDPASAAAWVDLFPDDQFRERAMRELQGITNYQQTNLAAP